MAGLTRTPQSGGGPLKLRLGLCLTCHRAAVRSANEMARDPSVRAVKIIDRRAAPVDMGSIKAGEVTA